MKRIVNKLKNLHISDRAKMSGFQNQDLSFRYPKKFPQYKLSDILLFKKRNISFKVCFKKMLV